MTIAAGYVGGGLKRPESLLEACCFWDRCQGGTIHAYLPRLRWVQAHGPCVRGMGPVPVWHLLLDERAIGWTQCLQATYLPAIEPSLSPNLLDTRF